MAFVCIIPNVNDLLLTAISKTCRICESNNWFCMSIFTGRQRSCGKQWFQSCYFALRGVPRGHYPWYIEFHHTGTPPLYRTRAPPPYTHTQCPPPVYRALYMFKLVQIGTHYRNPSTQTHVQICSFWSTYGRQVSSWHPAGILSCWYCKSLPWPKVIKWATWKSTRTSGKITMHVLQVFNLL